MSVPHIIISFLLPLLFIIGLTSTFVYIFKKKFNFQQLLPIALMSAVLAVYIATMVSHNILVSIWLIALFAACSIPLLILDKQRSKVVFENILTPGFVMFILLYIILYIINFNKVVPLLSDSSMHWAPHVWTMWLRNDFYTSPGLSIVNHGDYTPALQLFELIWMKLAGIWHEGFLFMALEVFGFSLLFPAVGKITWKNTKTQAWSVIFLFSITLLVLPLLLPVSYFYNSLEIDTVLALIFAYGVYLALTESKQVSTHGLIKLGIVITFLCLTKQIGLVFAAIIVIIFVGNVWLSTRLHIREALLHLIDYVRNYRQNWRDIALVCAIFLSPLILLSLWSAQTADYKSPDKGIAIFHLGINEVKQIPGIILGQTGNESQQAYTKHLAKYLIQNPIGFLINFFGSISYLQFFFIATAIVIIVGYKCKDKLSQKRLYFTSVSLLVGWGLYLFVIIATFLVGGMKDIERDTMATNDRYLRTYIFALLVIMMMWLITAAVARINNKVVVIWAVCLLGLFGVFINLTSVGSFKVYTPTIHSYDSELLQYDYDDLSKLEDDGGTFTKPEKIIITEETKFPSFHYLQYKALPNRVTVLTDKMLSDGRLCETIQKHDYLIIDRVIKKTNNLNHCFESPLKMTEDEVYKIANPSKSDKAKAFLYDNK